MTLFDLILILGLGSIIILTIHNTKSGKYETLDDISTGCITDTMIGFGCRYGKLSELEAIYKAFD